MLCKLVALGPRLYIKDKWNIFDGIVVIVSVVDTVMELTQGTHHDLKKRGSGGLRALRLVRRFLI